MDRRTMFSASRARHHLQRRPTSLVLLPLSAALSVAAVGAITAGSAFLSLASTPAARNAGAPTLASTTLADPNHGIALAATWTTAAVLLGGYLVACFTGTLFSAALVAAAEDRGRHHHGASSEGMRTAVLHAPQLLIWSLIAGTVGVVARQFGHRGILGIALGRPTRRDWNEATALVLPLIVNEGLTPIAAWRRSRQLAPASTHDPRSTDGVSTVAGPVTIVAALVLGALVWPVAPIAAVTVMLTVLTIAYVRHATSTGVDRSVRYHGAVLVEAGLAVAAA
jgi:hypothetical protein